LDYDQSDSDAIIDIVHRYNFLKIALQFENNNLLEKVLYFNLPYLIDMDLMEIIKKATKSVLIGCGLISFFKSCLNQRYMWACHICSMANKMNENNLMNCLLYFILPFINVQINFYLYY